MCAILVPTSRIDNNCSKLQRQISSAQYFLEQIQFYSN